MFFFGFAFGWENEIFVTEKHMCSPLHCLISFFAHFSGKILAGGFFFGPKLSNSSSETVIK